MNPLRPNRPVSLADQLSLAADAVAEVFKGRSLTEALARIDPQQRAAAQALAFATMRRWGASRWVLSQLADRDPPEPTRAVLWVALTLLWPTGEPAAYEPHTVVNQAVAATKSRKPGTAAFVNGVLRRFLREREQWLAASHEDLAATYNHPDWWIQKLRRDWPDQWQALLAQASLHPPMTLRVNGRKCSIEHYIEELAAMGQAATAIDAQEFGGHAVRLLKPCPVQLLPGFAQGWVSVQDAAAQRAAPLLLGDGIAPGARVLDACCAPGGKCAHLLEMADVDLCGVDSEAERLSKVEGTLTRLGLRAELHAADAAEVSSWWDGRLFDAILLDAPCSASGIVRRHPDVPWLRRPSDIPALAATQARLLDALWPLLKPGGRFVYATCSVFKDEGQHQIDAFLQRLGPTHVRLDARSPGHVGLVPDNRSPEPSSQAVALEDGFFYALMHKT